MAVLSAVGSVIAVLLLIYVPGSVAAALLVRRPLTVLAVAPAMAYAMYSVGAMATTAAGVRWSPPVVAGWLVICFIVVALGAVVAGALDRRAPWGRRPRGDDEVTPVEPPTQWSPAAWWTSGAVVFLAAASGAGQIIRSSDLLRQPVQYWDAIFHGVAIRYIAEEGTASPSESVSARKDAAS